MRRLLRLDAQEAFSFEILRHSVDARRKPDLYDVYTVSVTLQSPGRERRVLSGCRNQNVQPYEPVLYRYAHVHEADQYAHVREADACAENAVSAGGSLAAEDRPVIVGTGPAGLFCGLLLARCGMKPVLIERGQRARDRSRTVQSFWEGGSLDPESNVQFGEGGAGTFSDGKLNTGIKDPDGRIRFILQTFVEAGADPSILYESHPHVGTDVLTKVVTHMTDEILERGGEVYFNTRLASLVQKGQGKWELNCIRTENDGLIKRQETVRFGSSRVVLAIGHSARDTFRMLEAQGIRMRPKAFAVGLRIQHPQALIDRAMVGEGAPDFLPPSPYKLTHRLPGGGGVYSFCMCPGGYVVNASSEKEMTAVNGMSFHDRASGIANSAVVVTVMPEEIASYMQQSTGQGGDVLLGMEFQRQLERAAFLEGGGAIPVQRVDDFRQNEISDRPLPDAIAVMGAYQKGNLRRILPEKVACGIEEGILSWERQIEGFASPEAVLAGVESRTSSPVRIERGDTLQAVCHPGLYPCGEGAGYAGGITSAAADGLRVAEAILDAVPDHPVTVHRPASDLLHEFCGHN